MKLQTQHLTDADRLDLARLLVKAGYTVRIRTEKIGNKSVKYVEAMEAQL